MSKPAHLAYAHRNVCLKKGCSALDTINYADPLVACPNGHFGVYGDASRLGDKIERIAKPIARAIDRVAGTKVANCGGCKKFKDRTNAGMSIAKALKLRIQGK